MRDLKDVKAERGSVWDDMKKLNDGDSEKFSADDQAKWDKMDARLNELDAEENRIEDYRKHERKMMGAEDAEDHKGLNDNLGGGQAASDKATEQYNDACATFLKRGVNRMPDEQRAILQVDVDEMGYIVAASERFIGNLTAAADDAIPFRQYATVYPCSYEEDLGNLGLEGDIGDFTFAGELTEAEEDDISFKARNLKAKAIRRKVVRISKRLLEAKSPKINVEQTVVQRVNVALGRTLNKKYLTGTGANEPLGVFIASANGISTASDVTGSLPTDVAPDDFIDVQDALKSAYQGKAIWYTHHNTITKLRKKKASTNDYIWQPGVSAGVPNLILGKPYVIDDYCPNTYTASKYVALYGDFSYYAIADGFDSMTIQRLVEKYALTGEVGLLFDKLSADGRPMLGEAFKRLKTAAA